MGGRRTLIARILPMAQRGGGGTIPPNAILIFDGVLVAAK